MTNSIHAPTSEPYLQVRGVRKAFGSFVALDGVTLDVRRGEFICFLGPSGCGKTTLLRIIAGLERADEGAIVQSGRDITRLPAAQRDFGIVFQSYALFPNLSAAQNVAYGLEGTRMPKAEVRARVAELLALVGLPEVGARYPAQLSGGQQQRVALARALALAPGLLLLDEPLSALDARVRVGLRAQILQLHRRLGITSIMVTHDQEEALTMADRIVVMDQGRIAQVGTPLEVYAAPATPFVADFVGTMNFIPAVTTAAGQARFGAAELPVQERAPRLEAGSPVTLAIRPEEIELPEAAGQIGALPGEVRATTFLGATCRLQVQLALGGEVLLVDLPAREAQRRALAPGAAVVVGLPRAALRAFPAAAAQQEAKRG